MFYGDRRRLFKKEASALLSRNFAGVILGSFIVLAVFGGVFLVETLYASLFAAYFTQEVIAPVFLALEIFTLILLCPLLYGWISWLMQCMRERKLFPLHTIFYSYSSLDEVKKAVRVIVFYTLFTLAAALSVMLIIYAGDSIPSLFKGFGFGGIFSVILKILCTAAAFAVIIKSFGILCVMNISQTGEYSGIFDAFKTSARIMKGHKAETLFFILSFLPLAALSVFTFGILFVVYTLPYFLLSLCAYTDYLCRAYEARMNKAKETAQTT